MNAEDLDKCHLTHNLIALEYRSFDQNYRGDDPIEDTKPLQALEVEEAEEFIAAIMGDENNSIEDQIRHLAVRIEYLLPGVKDLPEEQYEEVMEALRIINVTI